MFANPKTALCFALASALAVVACDDEQDDNPAADVGETAPDASTGDAGFATPDAVAPDPDAAPPPAFDEAATIAAAIAYADGDFTRVNAAPMASQHATNAVDIWVRNQALEAYLAVDPANTDARPDFGPGTIIVKAHQRDDGSPDGLTVMAKADPGFDPDHDDWWWARIENNGNAPFSGVVNFCVNCHTPRADTNWVFGVAPEDRAD